MTPVQQASIDPNLQLTDDAKDVLKTGFDNFKLTFGELYTQDLISASGLTVIIKVDKWDLLDYAAELKNSKQVLSIEQKYYQSWALFGTNNTKGQFQKDLKKADFTCEAYSLGYNISYNQDNCNLTQIEQIILNYSNPKILKKGEPMAVSLIPFANLSSFQAECNTSKQVCANFTPTVLSSGQETCV